MPKKRKRTSLKGKKQLSSNNNNNNNNIFHGKKFIISNVYTDQFNEECKKLIIQHGGIIVTTPSKKVHYLVQGWEDDDCDERLELCSNTFGILAVSYEYLKDCVDEEKIIPFHLYGLNNNNSKKNILLNPLINEQPYVTEIETGKCLLGMKNHGNLDDRCRETEEINQTINQYANQNWPNIKNDEKRNVIYIFSFITSKNKSSSSSKKGNNNNNNNSTTNKKDDDVMMINENLPNHIANNPKLQEIMKDFLNAYFDGYQIKSINDELLNIGKKKVTSHGLTVRSARNGNVRLLNVLDLLDVCHEKLPNDAYCILGITDQDIYEYDAKGRVPYEYLDGCLRGRAFGGSRIAVFSTACYGRSIEESLSNVTTPSSSNNNNDNSNKNNKTITMSNNNNIYNDFVYQLSTLAHETMHCFGLDHCGLYMCCMNSWNDAIVEFAKVPLANGRKLQYDDDVEGSIHLCPLCLRKLQITCNFEIETRYKKLHTFYKSVGLHDQTKWIEHVLRIGKDLVSKGK